MNEGNTILISAITPSATNPRKSFPKDKLDELTDSVKRLGVLQPILLRPLNGGGTYELVAGERRYRASKAAGLERIPATVRELTDAEVLEIQVVENLQRSDLHELEEAEGYEKLLRCVHPSGEKYTVDEIAAKVGKSRSYVFARLKLCALCPEAKKAFLAGDVDASKALLIARIGHHDTQRQALKDINNGRYGRGDPMSYREAHDHILQNYMLKLSSAPFDTKDAGLNVKAGACGPCPKRTGNQADLFGDVKSADVCTDPKCFDDKRQAHYRTAAVSLEAQGFKVIAGEAAKKILPHWEHDRPGNQYINLSNGYEKFEGSTYVSGRSRPVKSLFDKDFKPAKLQHPLTGEIFDVVTQQAIAAAAKKMPTPKSGKKTAARQHREPEKKPEQIFRERLYLEVVKKIPAEPSKTELRLLAKETLQSCETDALLADHFAPRKDGKKHDFTSAGKALEAATETMDRNELLRFAVAVILGHDVAYTYGQPKQLLEVAKLYKVDGAKVKKAIADEAKEAAETAKATAAAAKVKKAKSAPKAKVENKVETAQRAKKKASRVASFTPLIKPMK